MGSPSDPRLFVSSASLRGTRGRCQTGREFHVLVPLWEGQVKEPSELYGNARRLSRRKVAVATTGRPQEPPGVSEDKRDSPRAAMAPGAVWWVPSGRSVRLYYPSNQEP